jgi:hypothetical protein
VIADGYMQRMAAFARHDQAIADALDALTEVLLSPVANNGYPPRAQALLRAVFWLEADATCGDCVEGRCHFGGDDPHDGEECGCERHEASVDARDRRARLEAAGLVLLRDDPPAPA